MSFTVIPPPPPRLSKMHSRTMQCIYLVVLSPRVWNSPWPFFIFLLFCQVSLSSGFSGVWMGECPSSIGWALRSSAAADKGRRGWAHTLVPSTPGRAEGNSLNLKGPNQTWTQGRSRGGNSPLEAQETERGSAGASSTPFPGPLRAGEGAS